MFSTISPQTLNEYCKMRVLTPRIRISIRILPLRISGPAVIHLRIGAAAYIEPISGSQQAGSERELVLIVDRATWGSRLYLKEQVPWEAWWAKTSGEEARGLGEGLGGGEEELLLRGWWQVGLSSRCSTLMRPPLLRLLHPTTPRSLVDLCADSAGAAGNVPTRNSNLPPSGACGTINKWGEFFLQLVETLI